MVVCLRKDIGNISLRERFIEEFMKEKGLSSVNEAILLLLEYKGIYPKFEYLLRFGARVTPNESTPTPTGSNLTPGESKLVTEKQMELLVDLLNELREIVTSEEDVAFLDEIDAILTKLSKAIASRIISALKALKRGDRNAANTIKVIVERCAEES